jgi:pyruvate/2-oxoacid:ferredoxin oxidoreductase beta subunit
MYNNYNPYYQQPRFQQPMPQMEQQPQFVQPTFTKPSGLQGKQVDSVEVVKATDVPFDGSISYFPLTDGTAIVTKQLQTDGTSKIVVFKPVNETKEEIKYLTNEDLEKAIKTLNLDEIDDIKEELKEIKKQLKKKGE